MAADNRIKDAARSVSRPVAKGRSAVAQKAMRSKTHRQEIAKIDTVLPRIREHRSEIEQIGEETRALLRNLGVR